MEKQEPKDNCKKELNRLEKAYYVDKLITTTEFENARAYLIEHPDEHIDLYGPTPAQEKSLT
jgi:hypothetical protein